MNDSAAPAGDRCAACGAAFHCGANDPAPCPCSTLTLGATQLAALRLKYTGCLCLGCLLALQEPRSTLQQDAQP